ATDYPLEYPGADVPLPEYADLPSGLYERLVTSGLKRELDALAAKGGTLTHTGPLDPAEAARTLAQHIETLVVRALEGLPHEQRPARQAELANRLVALLAADEDARGAVRHGDAVVVPPAQLHAVWPVSGDPARDRQPPRPEIPLS